ncbi:hypothetical protein Pcinc_019310 [Petrolisthes cinctipes]|uniref:Hcy-binding domain-containing protein n=1 Tax=Petrolisthes cinctipes TaxID=88211 RepID=A0AAE1FLU2_PETCI|nr:hypothetical protein Pcinc_036997 [Petrolisthes cinctipes]KAK3875840.1 hypothetical protein Pcinc_019310 [Petrolisthes cinctipes]
MLKGRVWVLDGGLASTLQQEGEQVDGDPLWSARLLYTNPDAIKKAHLSFLSCGANILTTASYQASIPGFTTHLGITQTQALSLIARSVSLARTAIEEFTPMSGHSAVRPLLVAGSVGPYGACQADGSEYTGAYISRISPSELKEWHRPRIEVLVGAGVDLLAVETIPAVEEALAILELLQEFPGTKAWVTFSCKDGQHTSYGDEFGAAVQACHERGGEQLVGVGVNCSPPHYLAPLLTRANATLPSPDILPRVVYPNSGEEWVAGKGWEGRSAGTQSCIKEVREWRRLGASVIGGCCRLGPPDIRIIADTLANSC